MNFVALEKLINLHDGYRRVFRVGRDELVLLQEQGRVHLFANRCPHQGLRLHQGTVRGDIIQCPNHGQCFRLLDGAAVTCNGQPVANGAALPVKTIAYDGDAVGIDL